MTLTPLQFGISQFSTWPQTFEQDLQLYQESGIQHIEVCEAKLEVANPHPQLQRLNGTGLNVSSIQPRLHSLFPDQPRPLPESPGERMARLRDTINLFGPYFPGTTIVTITGAAPGGNYDFAYRTAAHEYKEAARAAADRGMRLALEPLNPILMNVDTFICSLTHAARIVEAVDHPAFGLFVDVWHLWEDAAVCAGIKRLGSKIYGVHVNDWRTPRAFGDRHLPGEGEIPLVAMLRAIRESGYAGVYTLEVFSEIHLEGSLWADPRRTVMEGKKAFAKIWEQVCV